jgi:hypothetical protein
MKSKDLKIMKQINIKKEIYKIYARCLMKSLILMLIMLMLLNLISWVSY